MKERDTRMKQMTEILSGIKVLKLYAWELPFMDRINKIREKEIGFLRTMVKLYVCCINFTFACSPFLITLWRSFLCIAKNGNKGWNHFIFWNFNDKIPYYKSDLVFTYLPLPAEVHERSRIISRRTSMIASTTPTPP